MSYLQDLLQCSCSFCRKVDCEVGFLALTVVLRDCSESSSWKWNVILLSWMLKLSRRASKELQRCLRVTSQSNRVSSQKVV